MNLVNYTKKSIIQLCKLYIPRKFYNGIKSRLRAERFIQHKKNRDYIDNVDIVVCVHNALDDVKLCLGSIETSTKFPHRVIIVNDGSDDITSKYLNEHCSSLKNSELLISKEATGYTQAANRGLRKTNAKLVILLNSDTIVSNGWLNEIVKCFESDNSIGIAGPLSNAASWQSVPEVLNKSGDWEVNELPNGWSIDDMGDLVQENSSYSYPRIPFVNGFCYAIRRTVINRIGFFDEKTFSKGYGEENDYCIRAEKAGFSLAIVDSAYVYHAKSRSFTHDVRKTLAKKGRIGLEQKHGKQLVKKRIELMRDNSALLSMQRKTKIAISKGRKIKSSRFIRILFLLPVSGGGGGVHSIIQEACGMIELGAVVKIAVPSKWIEKFRNSYKNVNPSLFVEYIPSQFDRTACEFDLVIATIFTSVRLLQKLSNQVPSLKLAYYIQDYEPWITEENSDRFREAEESYTLIPNMILFAKTDWLCNIVKEKHGVSVYKVMPSLDTKIYYPDISNIHRNKVPEKVITIVAMVRPSTPRRGASITMDILREIKSTFEDEIYISIFGCLDSDFEYQKLNKDFDHFNHGILTQSEVAKVLRTSDIFVDFSTYQAFGRTGLEAMSCGCSTILPLNGGVNEYAIHNKNSLIIDTSDREKMISALTMLIENKDFRNMLSKAGLQTAQNYSILKAALSELSLFKTLFRF